MAFDEREKVYITGLTVVSKISVFVHWGLRPAEPHCRKLIASRRETVLEKYNIKFVQTFVQIVTQLFAAASI